MVNQQSELKCDGATLTTAEWNQARSIAEALQAARYIKPSDLDRLCRMLKCQ